MEKAEDPLAETDGNAHELLLEMGFTPLLARRALAETGNTGLEPAINWLSDHQNDPEPTEEEVMNIEEVAAKAASIKEKDEIERRQELLRRREKDKENEELDKIKAERERRKVGREMQNMRERMKEESQRRAIEERKRDMMEDAAYMKQLRMQIELERKEKYGSPAPKQEKAAEKPAQTPSPCTSSESRIQIIVPDSPRLLKIFPSSSPLSEVYDFVSRETGKVDFDLVPLVKISDYDPKLKDKPLSSLGLARGASLLLAPWG